MFARRLTPLFITLGLLLSVPAFAQESGSGGTTGSGSTTGSGELIMEPVGPDPAWLEERAKRLENFSTFLLKGNQNQLTYRKAVAAYRTKRLDVRRRCREEIRYSNRDQLLKTKLACVHDELNLDENLLRASQTYVENIPTLSVLFRQSLLPPIQSAVEAVSSFVNAIDQGVFETETQLLEARKNLQKTYRAPMEEAMTLVRNDRLLMWIIRFRNDLQQTKVQQETLAGASLPAWQAVDDCFAGAEEHLHQVLLPEEMQKKEIFRLTLGELAGCAAQAKALTEIIKK